MFPIVSLAELLVYSLVAAGVRAPAGSDMLEIEVTGYRWWEVNYLYRSRDVAFTSANETQMPVGRPVLARVFTADVIHALWTPNLAGKIGMIPGRINRFRSRPMPRVRSALVVPILDQSYRRIVGILDVIQVRSTGPLLGLRLGRDGLSCDLLERRAPAPLGSNIVNNHVAKRATSRHDNTIRPLSLRRLTEPDLICLPSRSSGRIALW